MGDINGWAAHAAGAELSAYKYKVDELAPDDVEVKVSHCGICHSDLHLIDNDWGMSKYPFVPGHEIVGKITAVGANVRDRKPGQRVGIGWQADSCGLCEWCRRGEENLCPKGQPTCIGRNGGWADKVRVNWRFSIPVPESLESENVAPLLCAGITVYSPLRRWGARPASRVGVIGIGGLGHLALQFAKAFGCDVTAFSSSPDKEAEAKTLGAHAFVNTRTNGALKKLAGSFDLILSTANVDQDFAAYVTALRPNGTLVVLGASPKPLQVAPFALISHNKVVAGSNTGSPMDLAEMLSVAALHDIKAMTESFAMKSVNDAVAKVRKNQVRYRAVLTA